MKKIILTFFIIGIFWVLISYYDYNFDKPINDVYHTGEFYSKNNLSVFFNVVPTVSPIAKNTVRKKEYFEPTQKLLRF